VTDDIVSPPLLNGVSVVTVLSSGVPLALESVCVVVDAPLALVTVCATVVRSSVVPSVRSLDTVRVTVFDVVEVTVVIRLVTVVPAELVTVSVRVPPLDTTASTDPVAIAALPSIRLTIVRVSPPLVTVDDVTSLAVPSGLRFEITNDVAPLALVVSVSCCVVQPPPSWSRWIETTVAPETTVVVVVVELSFSEPDVPELVSSPVDVMTPPK
jgi:hypothetical protein